MWAFSCGFDPPANAVARRAQALGVMLSARVWTVCNFISRYPDLSLLCISMYWIRREILLLHHVGHHNWLGGQLSVGGCIRLVQGGCDEALRPHLMYRVLLSELLCSALGHQILREIICLGDGSLATIFALGVNLPEKKVVEQM